MFTGIIETAGTVVSVDRTGGGPTAARRLRIAGRLAGEPLSPGESIAVDGVCQTVTDIYSDGFAVEVMERTVDITTFATLRPGQAVNLERALTLGSRLGGHLVTGHVDGVGTVEKIGKLSGSTLVRIRVPAEIGALCVLRGSVTVSGVSLTIAGLGNGWIEVSLVGTTVGITTLSGITIGSRVNLETDIIGKYVKQYLAAANEPSSRGRDDRYMKLLQEEGFL